MPFIHGKSATVLVGGYNLSGYFNEASVSRSVETAETTTFGNSAKTYITGLSDGTVSVSGLFDGDTGATDAVLSATLGDDTGFPTTIAVDGMAVGKRVIFLKSKSTSYEVTSPVADVVSANAEFQADGRIDNGISIANAVVSDKNGTNVASYDNTTSTSNGAAAILHVTANTMDAGQTFKIQHSADNSTWADLVNFSGVSAAQLVGLIATVASGTTVNRYVRLVHGGGGTSGAITFSASFARR